MSITLWVGLLAWSRGGARLGPRSRRFMLLGLALGWSGVSAGAESLRFRALEFASNLSGYAEAYAETSSPNPAEHGLAVDPKKVQERFSAAEVTFHGLPGFYTVGLLAVAEEDGESEYRLQVNDAEFEPRINPKTDRKRLPIAHRWTKVWLRPNDRLRVLFAGRSNGQIPEGTGFAWSRGRWRSLELTPEDAK